MPQDLLQAPTTPLFRNAMAQVPAAVHVVTTHGPAGLHGTTATAFSSLSDDPPSVLVCINRQARLHDILRANGRFCVNQLSGGQAALAATFASSKTGAQERFDSTGPWDLLADVDGADHLAHPLAAARLACAVTAMIDGNTHSIFIGRVTGMLLADAADALAYHRRAFLPIGTVADAMAPQ